MRYCLVRRALAFDQANLMEFKLMEAWNEKLMQSRLEDPSPGFSRTTMKQLELADRKLFCILAEKTREGIKTTVKGRPLDLVFKECTESSEVLSLLQPRPGVAAAEKSKEPRSNSAEPPSKKPKREAGKKGKGKGNNGAFVRIPHDLLKLNCVAATPKNNWICFSYNLKKCDTTGQKCSKGLHVCAVQGCFRGHPALECQKSRQKQQGYETLGKALESSASDFSSEGEPDEDMHVATTTQPSGDFSGMSFRDVEKCIHRSTEANTPYIFLELCAGSASLSAEVRRLGVEVLAFDLEANRHQTKCKVISLDLSLPHAFERLEALVTTCHVLAVHMGPPCGTCSKARGIPMADSSAGPQPLRDEHNLLGLPNLGRRDQERVSAANALYARLGLLVETLERLQIPWTIENPTNSFLWDLPDFAFAMAHGNKHDCHACAFGSSRKKLTSFLSDRDEFAALSKFCHEVAPHDHEGWGYDQVQQCFNTARRRNTPR